ncbi:hypothetical protein ACS0TY_014658 [Phlomoides rotata]
MKILTYNIRGLGSKAKLREVRELIREHKIDFCCIQESKKEVIDEFLCRAVWGEGNFSWAFREADGRSGGLLSVWNSDKFAIVSNWHMLGAVIVNGLWGADRIQCCIINVYAPCPLVDRIDLWDRLLGTLNQVAPSCICLAGDFNSIRRVSERAGRMAESCKRDIEAFDDFVRDSGLLDLPLHGRSFTWYRPDGSCKSHLDRILVNNTWMLQWPNSMQK